MANRRPLRGAFLIPPPQGAVADFTIIDCCMDDSTRADIVAELKRQRRRQGVTRFISTHPDDDHLRGLVYLDDQLDLLNFYCVRNAAIKEEPTDDFERYCSLRKSEKAFYLSVGCSRRWLNDSDETRKTSGISILWPKTDNAHYKAALREVEKGLSPNNISAVIRYRVKAGPTVLWMGDLKMEFMENISASIKLPAVDILFAPHHGRDSGTIPASMLEVLSPKLIVVGEAPSKHLHYYPDHDTITQNTAGDITFDCGTGWADVYVSSSTYFADCLQDRRLQNAHGGYYIGSLVV